LLADIVQMTDIGMIERRDRPRLALEALSSFRLVRQMSR